MMEVASLRFNKTCKYLVRPLGFIKKEDNIDEFMKKLDFVQAFIGDIQAERDYECPVYLMFKKDNKYLDMFMEAEYKREKTRLKGTLVEDYDYPGYVVLVYEFPEEYRADYHKILWGRYSKTSEAFRFIFPKEKKDKDGTRKVTHAYRVLHKVETLRIEMERELDVEIDKDSELESIPNIDNTDKYTLPELLDISNYRLS